MRLFRGPSTNLVSDMKKQDVPRDSWSSPHSLYLDESGLKPSYYAVTDIAAGTNSQKSHYLACI
jgi:hypothetical protein